MRSEFNQYTTDYIGGVMSLRAPQQESLEILKDIFTSVNPGKNMNMDLALATVREKYHTCVNFEREFMSLTFALATGVGKTRLMGAFIAYLYTNHDIKNFFVVAPNTTIYDKLKSDLGDRNSEKYVFKSLSCFSNIPPEIIKDDDYRDRSLPLFTYSARIFIFNIDKFNREDANMRRVTEVIGNSFYQYLSELNDLVLIMDESHHYRATRGLEALNALKPLLGLELTATPFVNNGSRQVPFKNVVYDYPMAKAIADKYIRVPRAMTRADFESSNFGNEELDKAMLADGIKYHELVKQELRQYAINNSTPEVIIPIVKPFVLVVCKDTEHATKINNYICSNEFKDGYYRDKTIMIHSRQTRMESDENTRLLLAVENPENPIEIVIHVNKLKEGWDVNNLYTIIPLRTATSEILRRQMVGRGMRLPYGKYTGERDIDAIMLTAHDKFDDIVNEAERQDSIFKRENLIDISEIEVPLSVYTQIELNLDPDTNLENAYQRTNIPRSEEADNLINTADSILRQEVIRNINNSPEHTVSPAQEQHIVAAAAEALSNREDLQTIFSSNEGLFTEWMIERTREVTYITREKFIPIPKIRYTEVGAEECYFRDFDLDIAGFNHVPVENDLIITRLGNQREQYTIAGDKIDFSECNPQRIIMEELRKKPEINYSRDGALLIKLVGQVCTHYERSYGPNGMRNIVVMYKTEISNKIYNQMMQNFCYNEGLWEEEIVGVREYNLPQEHRGSEIVDLYSSTYTGNIRSVVFNGIRKGVFSSAKFDSEPELILARILESNDSVLNWLKPKMDEFNIRYKHNHRYNPDFVVEISDTIFLVEVKGENMLNDEDVLAKKDSGIRYCELASAWGQANGYKKWKYLFIPSGSITPSSTFLNLAQRFVADE